MHGNVTNEEWQIFKEAYQYFSDHCLPPANQDENAVDWWMSAAKDMGELDQKWKDYPLMRSLLLAIYEYMEFKAKEKTRQVPLLHILLMRNGSREGWLHKSRRELMKLLQLPRLREKRRRPCREKRSATGNVKRITAR